MDSEAPPIPPAADVPGPQPQVPLVALSDELHQLVDLANGGPLTVARILHHLGDRGYLMLAVIITLPFLLLPTTFGLSAPMGFAVALIGFCITLERKPWLPGFILRKSFPNEALTSMSHRAAGLTRRIETFARPRLGIMFWPGLRQLAGLNLAFWSLLMAVPGPNNLFAAMMLLIAFGLLMRDGLLLLIAHAITLATPILLYLFWTVVEPYVMPFVQPLFDRAAGLFR